jgi:hypothetical protein
MWSMNLSLGSGKFTTFPNSAMQSVTEEGGCKWITLPGYTLYEHVVKTSVVIVIICLNIEMTR